ncbi:tetratricopeptide repeat protein [Pseudoalteromonas sp. SSDWG2]|uniref:tetratricopeptide repeat protein n=1 Tax=Pseudoalteromonas sp. SSDWG2 TaxID=3139391 RepID=UPI003BACBE38
MKPVIASLFFAALMSHSVSAEVDADLANIMRQWAHVNYEIEGKDQEKAFEQLAQDANTYAQSHPELAEGYIWAGIIHSSYAGAKGGLGALGLAKEAKKDFEKAIAIDGNALQGSAYTSLGTLYAQVPGWPIGFGSDKEAQKLFDKSLEINPDGIDINYFYAQFLYDERDYKKAKMHLLKAQAAQPRVDRPLADKYRHEEVDVLLAKVERKLRRK